MVDGKFTLWKLNELLESTDTNPSSLNVLETLAEQLSNKTGRQMLQRWLQECEEANPAQSTRCRSCGEVANYISKRAGFVHTKLGLVRYLRAYYVCPQCHHSTCPLDERLNPYESLARLRKKIASGKSLPVDEIAKTWGLGSLTGFPQNDSNSERNQFPNRDQTDRVSDKTLSIHSSLHSTYAFREPIPAEM